MSQPPPAKRRKKMSGNQNYDIEAPEFEANQVSEAIELLKSGKEEAIIINSDFGITWDGPTMVRYFNSRCKPDYRVPVPNDSSELSLKTYNLPGIAGGMWHAYCTRGHDDVIDSAVFDKIATEITGDPNWKVCPNRYRFNPVNKDDGWKQAHLEGEHVMLDTSDIGCIVCESVGRTFTYYKGSNNDPDARKLYSKMGGPVTRFVMPKQHQIAQWPRVTIRTTKPGQIILFAGSVIHEISRKNKSLSLFLSPYNTQTDIDEESFYSGLSKAAAISKKKTTPGAPPLPWRFLPDGTKRQHPKEYAQLTRRQSDIFGSLFHSGGAYWPSGKPTFFMFHMMAFNAWSPKLLPFMFDEQGKYNYEVITPELVAECTEFDPSYFEQLPFAQITLEEIEKMKAKYSGIPSVAWHLIKYWTKDIRQCSDNVCRRRGYI
jgi:hypothetical protein